MATVYYSACDRCGKEIKYKGKISKIFNKTQKKSIKLKVLSVFKGNPTGYDYSERYVELCKECTKQLDEFLNNN